MSIRFGATILFARASRRGAALTPRRIGMQAGKTVRQLPGKPEMIIGTEWNRLRVWGRSKCLKIWWSWPGSNRRPHRCERCALPAELQPHTWVGLLTAQVFYQRSRIGTNRSGTPRGRYDRYCMFQPASRNPLDEILPLTSN